MISRLISSIECRHPKHLLARRAHDAGSAPSSSMALWGLLVDATPGIVKGLSVTGPGGWASRSRRSLTPLTLINLISNQVDIGLETSALISSMASDMVRTHKESCSSLGRRSQRSITSRAATIT